MKCPKCGTNNRPNAKFCARCRSPLSPPMTMKLCPRCGKQNRLGARFCASCGYTFATGVGLFGRWSRPRHVLYAAGAVAVVLGLALAIVLLAGTGRRQAGGGTPTATATMVSVGLTQTATSPSPTPTPVSPTPIRATATHIPPTPSPTLAPPTSTPPSSGALNRALLATVQIIVPLEGRDRASTGSGSILTEKGHILTNFHVVSDPDTGQPYNRRGVIFIAVSPPDLKGPPEVKYVAEVVQSDRDLDLALLKIIANQDGGDLPADLGLTTMPVGDSDTVKIGDELSIIGFPGLGGETVTFTKGSVSGFLTGEGWIKTDAEINPGNSGGAAINRQGQLVGIPSAASTETVDLPGKIGLVRPVNLAQPLIDVAMRD